MTFSTQKQAKTKMKMNPIKIFKDEALQYYREKHRELFEERERLLNVWIKHDLIHSVINEIYSKKIDYYKKKIKYLTSNNKNDIDILRIKEEIKIEYILDIYNVKLINKKFKIRNERTPSCSIIPNINRWHDFGSGEGGSVIDLVMIFEECEFKDAIRKLNKML